MKITPINNNGITTFEILFKDVDDHIEFLFRDKFNVTKNLIYKIYHNKIMLTNNNITEYKLTNEIDFMPINMYINSLNILHEEIDLYYLIDYDNIIQNIRNKLLIPLQLEKEC